MHDQTRRRRPLIPATALITTSLLAALAGCGSDEAGGSDQQSGATRTAANGDVFNEADVAFATDMIPHHAQALQMVDLTRGHDVDPEVAALTEDIQAAQATEIETMVDWLTAWGEPIPDTPRDHANAHGDGSMDADHFDDLDGMTSAEDMAMLEEAPDSAFQEMWLEMMIEHHESALEMAQEQQAEGHFGPAVEMAAGIVSAQQKEMDLMTRLLEE